MMATLTKVAATSGARSEMAQLQHSLQREADKTPCLVRRKLEAVEQQQKPRRMKEQIADLLDLVDYLREQLYDSEESAQMQARSARLRYKEIQKLEMKLNALRRSEAKKVEQVTALQADLSKATAENQQLQVELSEVKVEMKSKQEAADAMICLLNSKLEAAVKNMYSKQEQISGQQGALTFLAEELHDSREAEQIMSRAYHRVDDDNKRLQEQLMDLRVAEAKNAKQITSLKQDNSQLRVQHQQLLLELSELRVKVQDQQESALCLPLDDKHSSSSGVDGVVSISSEATKMAANEQRQQLQKQAEKRADPVTILQNSLTAVNINKPVNRCYGSSSSSPVSSSSSPSSSSSSTDPTSPITPDLSARNSAAVSDGGDDGSTAGSTDSTTSTATAQSRSGQWASSGSSSSSSSAKYPKKVKAVVCGGMQRAASWCSRHLKKVNSRTESWYHSAVDSMRC